jgi:hypothetical protein
LWWRQGLGIFFFFLHLGASGFIAKLGLARGRLLAASRVNGGPRVKYQFLLSQSSAMVDGCVLSGALNTHGYGFIDLDVLF